MPASPNRAPEVVPTPGVQLASSGWLVGEDHYGEVDKNWLKRLSRSMGASAAIELSVFLLIGLILAYKPVTQAIQNQIEPVKYVYLQQPGPGGGGGGSPAPAPPKPMSIPKHAEAPAPVVPPEVVKPVEPPKPELNAPIETTASTAIQATGFSSVSLAAYGGGGSGGGLGAGRGNGVGEGTGGGFGGGAYQPGNGVSSPTLIRNFEPKYTSDAMRAKIQGVVELDAVVQPNGTVGDVRIIKSLDKQFGLDQEAIKAAKLWVFKAGTTRDGTAVPVVVRLILEFRLH
jgi:periplasmic protein TonB